MESPANLFESLIETAENYGTSTFKLAKLQALDFTTTLLTKWITRLCVFVILSVFLIILNLGIAFWLGDLLGKTYYGFFIVAGFYLVTGIILHYFLYDWIKKPVGNLIINQPIKI